MTEEISIFEVGPRDGLQNEKTSVPLEAKLEFIRGLVAAGLQNVEIGAFVRADKVPQMADTEDVLKKLEADGTLAKTCAWMLVPNEKGLERALAVGAKNLAVFTGATDQFVKKNIGMSVEDSLRRFEPLIDTGKKKGVKFRGYVSTAFGCPYEGKVDYKKALKVVERLLKLGVFQVSIGDTIGIATPGDVRKLVSAAVTEFGSEALALHFHDTRGLALANTLTALELGVRVFDSSASGLGGCPYAPGASGNLATEELVYMLDGMGFKTGVDLKVLSETSLKLAEVMRRIPTSRYLQAVRSKK